ncbi:MAG: hypothetical protein AB1Y25_04780, partial [Cycloclasticus sp.]
MDEIHVSDDIKPFLDDISERLWSGHAAIMVGAGFSKNAEPVNGSKNTFPSWAELGVIPPLITEILSRGYAAFS